MDPAPQPVRFVVRSPDFYRQVAENADDERLLRACLLLAADDIDRWRQTIAQHDSTAVPSA